MHAFRINGGALLRPFNFCHSGSIVWSEREYLNARRKGFGILGRLAVGGWESERKREQRGPERLRMVGGNDWKGWTEWKRGKRVFKGVDEVGENEGK